MPIPSLPRMLAALFVVVLSTSQVSAQQWGEKMFDRSEVKFGQVAKYSDTTVKLKVKNIYADPIQITSLGVSCGCISWGDQTPLTLASKEERELTLRLDTVRFSGDRNVRANISLYEPAHGYSDTVTLPVTARIRTDVEVRPSYVGFGPIDLGKGYTQRIGINYSGGRGDWKITQAKVSNPHLNAQIVEKSRYGGQASYEVLVVIDNSAPAGVLRDQLMLTTNEVGNSEISIPVEARVEPDIVVTDAQFGSMTPGNSKSMTVVVRGKKPFKIEKIDHVTREVRAKPVENGNLTAAGPTSNGPPLSTQPDEAFKVKHPETSAPVHTVTLTFTAPTEPGLFEEEFVVKIDGRAQPISFKAKGRIVDPAVPDVKK